MRLNKLHWLSAIIVFALVSGGVMHLFFSADAVPEQSRFTLSDKENLAAPSDDTANQQITALTMKVAELQSQVLRLNALGDRLAEEAKVPAKEFNFDQHPPSGGPVSGKNIAVKSLDDMVVELSMLQDLINYEEKQLKMLESLTLGHHIENTSYLSGRPISKGWLSSYFGVRKDPFTGNPAMHKGVDFAGKEGTNVIATGSGVVTWAGERYGYGQMIEINHGKGYKTRYGHNKTLSVKVGDVVTKGQTIAKMGSTGRSTGPHVHYEILRNNKQINPVKYVYRKAK